MSSRRTRPISRSCSSPPKGSTPRRCAGLAWRTTLLATLNSLQMGFRTLALEKRSAEVWEVLGAVKTEFGKFGGVLAKVRDQTQSVIKTLDQADVRTRQMTRALKTVESISEERAQALLPGLDAASDDEDAS